MNMQNTTTTKPLNQSNMTPKEKEQYIKEQHTFHLTIAIIGSFGIGFVLGAAIYSFYH